MTANWHFENETQLLANYGNVGLPAPCFNTENNKTHETTSTETLYLSLAHTRG